MQGNKHAATASADAAAKAAKETAQSTDAGTVLAVTFCTADF